MTELTIGANIAALRKEKGITQEGLANIVGLTAQAVSKWESGGSPDAALLPVIADYLGVSIDSLYGRKGVIDTANCHVMLTDYIYSFPEKERFSEALELLHSTFYTFFDMPPEAGENFDLSHFRKILEEVRLMGAAHSQIITDYGILKAGLDKFLPYILLMPEPEEGWGERLPFHEKYCDIFALLADPCTLRTLFFLCGRGNKHFTPRLLEKEFGFAAEKANTIMENLAKYKLIKSRDLEIDDEVMTIYEFLPNPSFIPLMLFASEMLDAPATFLFGAYIREEKPLLYKFKEATQ